MTRDLQITTEQVQGKDAVTVLHLMGWLDKNNEDKFYDAAHAAYQQGARMLVLDMAAVDTMTSAGMRALTKVYKLYTPEAEQYKDSRVKISGAPKHIAHVLGITGFLKYIPSHETMQEALDSFNG